MMLARKKFQNLSCKGKNQWILDYLMDHKNNRYIKSSDFFNYIVTVTKPPGKTSHKWGLIILCVFNN